VKRTLVVCVAGLLLAAIPAVAQAAPKTVTVGVVEDAANAKYGFKPAPIELDVGDTLVFVNDGAEEHDFVSLDGEAFGSDVVPPGGTFQYTFTQPGQVLLACDLHPFMETRVTVRG
jgi:plastocyanin